MFDKLQQGKELLKMRNQAMQIQKQLDAETVEVAKSGVKVKITLAQKVVKIESNEKFDSDILNAVNEAIKESQKQAAKRMQGMMGGLDALKGMLGG